MFLTQFTIITFTIFLGVQTQNVPLKRPVRQNILIDNPLFQLATRTSGNIFANTIRTLGNLPFQKAIRRSSFGFPTLENRNNFFDLTVGFRQEFPTLINLYNIPEDVQNQFTIDYSDGLHNEDVNLNITQLASKYGHPMETHKVITEDGYVLSLFRIPSKGPVIFLMHGILGSADDYVIAGPKSSLAYLLADEGYDVWLGNARGNKFSREHIELEASEADFWDFTWHEIGVHDVPAMIDYILDQTDKKTLKYIGHSQGTTVFFVMASERPDYNGKVSLMIALSPVAYMTNVKSPLPRLLAPGGEILHSFTKALGLYELAPDNPALKAMNQLMCTSTSISEIICSNIIFLATGFGFEQLNATNLPMIFSHMPSGAALKQMVHFGQEVLSGRFRQFDYGFAKNLERYGSYEPPEYILVNVVTPVALFYSEEDWLADPEDVTKLYNELGNAIDLYMIPFHPFNHLDFILAKDVKRLVYRRISMLLKKF